MNALIYKFLPFERKSYLEDEKLRFSQPRALNDPFECMNFLVREHYENYVLDFEHKQSVNVNNIRDKRVRILSRLNLALAVKNERSKVEQEGASGLMRIIQQIVDRFGSIVGILSLSRRWNSSLMWSHYTDRHRGFCVGFDPKHPFFAEETNQKLSLRKVFYGNERIDFSEEFRNPRMLSNP